MNNYFECAIKYEKTADNGKIVKVTEKHLVDALTFTEAESRIIEEIKPFISGEFSVKSIRRMNISEIFMNAEEEKFFKAKVNFISLDEEKGAEKKTSVFMLVQADDIKSARENLAENLRCSLSDWEIESISETKILEYFSYRSIG